jgi:hypothetical protein
MRFLIDSFTAMKIAFYTGATEPSYLPANAFFRTFGNCHDSMNSQPMGGERHDQMTVSQFAVCHSTVCVRMYVAGPTTMTECHAGSANVRVSANLACCSPRNDGLHRRCAPSGYYGAGYISHKDLGMEFKGQRQVCSVHG